ncbi:hypothetical protein PTSG_05907 [Salpingoeca rosetta]|uniref:N-acetyltransferase domain-containing protein n=1 Tax=Salpingoeca rosetta (strain ATCC 50818 / BSB-021) TaxID=946362 RepID=F2UD48_SALR5|nr:uncharacterized protein PTSG_05907 [Salpingoeca rosetta]EGD74543.1 hypothetical protein PTSG_05907 [Salpingoeca rosetta]|eukprot:XP_004992800.1 hypothetical protein PTSG_05907 [Salpingoeca rosetta]
MKKRIDRRVRTLIENGVHTRQRTCMVLVGSNAKDQVVNLHFMLEKASLRAKPSVLWCYKKDLGFTSYVYSFVIDEAAAIPLPLVKDLMGPYIVFMASTINGYEGTGRSLSLKLIQQLRKQAGVAASKGATHSKLRELTLDIPIRYAANDPVEAWLNGLLCLDSTIAPPSAGACPHPSACDLYSIDRDTLFSYNKVSEVFLQRMVALYVASHYRNTPNDLQLLSDAPAHRVFCLLAPITNPQELPEILCVIQVALEGEISAKTVRATLKQGIKQAGDLIPWTICQQYQDDDFGQLSGARIVRIATHPDYQGMGYGKRAIEQLKAFYDGKLLDLSESGTREKIEAHSLELHEEDHESLTPRKNLPPLIRKLDELEPDTLDYLGVSYGATPSLYKFWKKCGFAPFYMRQTANDLTGEHTCIMLNPLETARLNGKWLRSYWLDFQQRYMVLLGSAFRHFPPALGLGVLEPVPCVSLEDDEEEEQKHLLTVDELMTHFTPHDLKRLQAYVNQMADFHIILDLVPRAARLFFTQKLPVRISPAQQAILLGLGLQHKTIEDLEKGMGLGSAQLLGLFRRAVEQINKAFRRLREKHIEAQLPKTRLEFAGEAVEENLEEQLEEAGREEMKKLEEEEHTEQVDQERRELLLQTFSKYSIDVDDETFEKAVSGKTEVSRVSIPRKQELKPAGEDDGAKRRADDDADEFDMKGKKAKKGKKSNKSTPSKKGKKGTPSKKDKGTPGKKKKGGKKGGRQ